MSEAAKKLKELFGNDDEAVLAIIDVLKWRGYDKPALGNGKSSLARKVDELSDLIYKKARIEFEVYS